MLKIIFCLHRQPRLSRAEFQDYWLTQHGPLVAQKAAALGIRRYVQSHTSLDDAAFAHLANARGGGQAYDGVAELWIDAVPATGGAPSEETMRAARALLEDEGKFIDLPRSSIFYVREHEVIGPA